ncbi:MAG: hypothetical protein AAGF53_17840 [Pseudomonadota bacterium]
MFDFEQEFSHFLKGNWAQQLLRPLFVYSNLKAEMYLTTMLAHETVLLSKIVDLIPDREDLVDDREMLAKKVAAVRNAQNAFEASELTDSAYGAWSDKLLAALNHPDNPALKDRKNGGIASNVLTGLAGPVGRDLIDYLAHTVLQPVLTGKGDGAKLPIITVPFLLENVFKSPFGAGSRQPIKQALEMLESIGFTRTVRGYDEYIEAYQCDVGSRNPVSLFAAELTDEEIEANNRQPVTRNGSQTHRKINATTEMIMLTSKFFIFLTERDELAAQWNYTRSRGIFGVARRFLRRLGAARRIFGRSMGVVLGAAMAISATDVSAQGGRITMAPWSFEPPVEMHMTANAGQKLTGSGDAILASVSPYLTLATAGSKLTGTGDVILASSALTDYAMDTSSIGFKFAMEPKELAHQFGIDGLKVAAKYGVVADSSNVSPVYYMADRFNNLTPGSDDASYAVNANPALAGMVNELVQVVVASSKYEDTLKPAFVIQDWYNGGSKLSGKGKEILK